MTNPYRDVNVSFAGFSGEKDGMVDGTSSIGLFSFLHWNSRQIRMISKNASRDSEKADKADILLCYQDLEVQQTREVRHSAKHGNQRDNQPSFPKSQKDSGTILLTFYTNSYVCYCANRVQFPAHCIP
mmetsp:Transcript_26923/g.62544  ORF Transcript_26923/g.62544 Transcript_26923/m.62544 type:complete len:128 (-) Transcript_26923:311-694(-)